MFEIVRYEGRRRARGTLALTVFVGVFALLIVGLFPSIEAAAPGLEAYVESLPEAFRQGFGIEAIATIEGFLSTEFYQFVWLLLLGLYMAYAGGGAIAGDVETGRLDLVLATPVSRSRLIVETYLSLVVPIVTLNAVTPLVVFGSTVAIDESISFVDVLAVHLLSIPYLLVCASIGLVLSVLVQRADAAQRGGIAVVFLLFVVDSVTADTDFEWLGALSPTRYYDPTEILVDSSYDVEGHSCSSWPRSSCWHSAGASSEGRTSNVAVS
ncbi:ABC transporter permease subunit [Haloarculaceae archaeon H-GB11]|nr:ABC transporter permease subunit [Haloarculaceae archaeon H-GB11]